MDGMESDVVQAVAHDHGRGAGGPEPAPAAGDARRHVQSAQVPRAGPRLHRLRGRRKRQAGQEDGRVSPIPRRGDGGAGDPARGGAAAAAAKGRRAGPGARRRQPARRGSGRPAHRRRLAHPGLGQEPDHGLLRRPDHPRARHGEPDRRRAHGPQRPRRPALRHLLPLPGSPAAAARPSRRPRRPARPAGRRVGWRGVHHRRGSGHRADLLREPVGEVGSGRGGATEDRSRFRGGHRGRGGRPQGEAEDQVGAARSRRRSRTAPRAHRPGHRHALRPADRGHGRQGHDRLHEPPHLHRPPSRTDPPAARMARRGRPRRPDQGRDDRERFGSARMAAPHPQQEAPREAGEALPRPRRSPSGGARAGHVADRLRRAEPAHHLRGQADARPRAHAGDRPGEPRLPRQAGRSGGGLPRSRARAQAGPSPPTPRAAGGGGPRWTSPRP